ncbi:MAG: DUF951 domain-containing protein [Clostridiales bacterium]|nr:DUF951 domain-containing protein [Clostridiales bacterium]
MEKEFKLDDIILMKKQHPCGNDLFRVIRVGADVKIKCEECGRNIMMPRIDFKKRMKKNMTEEQK